MTRLALLGSAARDAGRSDSDSDILAACDGPATAERPCGVQFSLEDLFGCSIDLAPEKALREELRPLVDNEAVRV